MFVLRVTDGWNHWIVGPFNCAEDVEAWKEAQIEDLYRDMKLCITHNVIDPNERITDGSQ